MLNKQLKSQARKNKAFTIIELLVVIVVIGILAAITIVSYSGITNRAIVASIKSQLSEDSKLLKMYYIDHGLYPSTLDSNYCPLSPEADNRYCLKNMNGATLTYSGSSNSFTLTIAKNSASYNITEAGNIAQSAPSTSAESFVLAWGGVGDDYGDSVVSLLDGGYIIAGETYSFGSGSNDAFLAKYDSLGNLSWNKTWGGAGSDHANSIIKTSDGGYVIAGESNSYGAGLRDAFLAKFDTLGNILWSKTWGGNDEEWANSIAQTSDGGYIMAGDTWDYGSGVTDVFLAKYNASGDLSWSTVWGDDGIDSVNSIAQTSDGGYITAGEISSGESFSKRDAFIAKFDSSGSLSWDKTWGGDETDYANSIAQTSDGGYIMAGDTRSYGSEYIDAFLAKYDSSGNLSWDKTWGGVDSDRANSIAQTSDGGYIAAGETTSYNDGTSVVLLTKFDSLGNLSWAKTWGGTDFFCHLSSLSKTSDGSYLVIGGVDIGDEEESSEDVLSAKFKPDGTMNGCTSPMCQSLTLTLNNPTATELDPPANVSSIETVTATSPSATVTSPLATRTVIVAPL